MEDTIKVDKKELGISTSLITKGVVFDNNSAVGGVEIKGNLLIQKNFKSKGYNGPIAMANGIILNVVDGVIVGDIV